MLLNNIYGLMQITEEVAYQDPDSEFSRNLENFGLFVKNFINPVVLSQSQCGCDDPSDSFNSPGIMIQATLPTSLSNYGPGIVSVLARKMANNVKTDITLNRSIPEL